MAEHIGTVADVAAGRIQVGYTVFHALIGEEWINGNASLLEHPINAYQLKIQPAEDGTVRVTAVDLAAGIAWTNQETMGFDGPAWQRAAARRRADEVIGLARGLKPGAALRVT